MTDPRVQELVSELQSSQEFFERSTRCLTEADSSARPAAEMLTAAQQMAHVGSTLDWFLNGAFSGQGFDMDFESHMKPILACDSIEKGRQWVADAFRRVTDKISACSFEELSEPLPQGLVMGGAPRLAIVGGIVDHTAHHRGALTVYSRVQGRVPSMPYMDT